MKLREVAQHLLIDARKLTSYALNEAHPRGQHKARRLRERLGFTATTAQPLLTQIEALALDGEATVMEQDQHGQRYQVILPIRGVNGQTALVCTGWLVPPQSVTARLLTVYLWRQP